MRIEKRQLFQGAVTGLVLLPESEDESKLIDEFLCQPEGCLESDGQVKGKVELADGYGEHYIFLESRVNAEKSDKYFEDIKKETQDNDR